MQLGRCRRTIGTTDTFAKGAHRPAVIDGTP
jgi:hypothetical protein